MSNDRQAQLSAWLELARGKRSYSSYCFEDIRPLSPRDAIYLFDALDPHCPGENEHMIADAILVELVANADVARAYNTLDKWHA